MSYDVYLKSPPCEHCGRRGGSPDCPEPTYNLTPIFDLALTGEPLPSPEVSEFEAVVLGKDAGERPRGLRVLSGLTGEASRPVLSRALERLGDPELEKSFRELEPENKWGTLEDAREVIGRYLELAAEYPQNVWDVR